MAAYTLKTTLLKSNPQVIREFTIDDTATVELLFQVVGIIHGWKAEDTCFRLMYDIHPEGFTAGDPEESDSPAEKGPSSRAHKGTIISLATVLKNIDFDRSLKLTMPFPYFLNDEKNSKETSLTYFTDFDDNKCFVFRLERTGVKEGTSVPRLIRFSGFHPYIKKTSMESCNFIMSKLLSDNGFYGEWSYVKGDPFRVQTDKINGLLKRVINKGLNDYVYVSTTYAASLKTILSFYKVSDLKSLCRAYELYISQSAGKTGIVEKLAEYCDKPEFWENLLSLMTYTEYLDFKALCFNKKTVSRYPDLYTLRAFCLTDNYYHIPSEFLNYYEQRFNDKGDEDLIVEGEIKAAFSVCGRYYAMYDRDMCENAYRTMFPERSDLSLFKKKSELRFKFEKSERQVIKDKDSGTEYICDVDFEFFDRKYFESLLSDPVFKVLPYHTLSQSEAMDVLFKGIQYSLDTYSKMEVALMDAVSWDVLSREVIPMICEDIRLGKTGAEICKNICSNYITEKSFRTEPLLKIINDARKDIPLIPLKGNKISDSKQHFRICGKLY